MAKRQNHGFTTRDIDESVRPQDDFYHYANGTWLKTTAIPPEEPRWGSFSILRLKTERQLLAIVEELQKKRSAKKGSAEQMIGDFYASGMDMKRRNALGRKPLEAWLSRIEKLSSHEEMQELVIKLHRLGVSVLFDSAVDQDAKRSDRYALYLYQDGLGMPDRDYYLKDDTESKRVRDLYLPYVEGLFRLLGERKDEAREKAATVLRIETALAKVSMDKVTRREIEKTYHKKTLTQLSRLAPAFDWKRYFARLGAGTPSYLIVMQPKYFTALSKIFETTSLEEWKTYLSFHVANDAGGALSSAFVRHRFSFYGKALAGVAKMRPLWRRTLAVTNDSLGELLGQLYVAKHFPPGAKKRADELVNALFKAYAARIRALDWMSKATKKRALKKLSMMTHKIGYPKKWKSYKGLDIRKDDFFGNLERSSEYEHRREMRKLGKPVDREEWYMTPQMVNAYNLPTGNEIVFPAAILQPPYFFAEGDDSLNYGAIGSVIGHEMTHGFDDEGAKFDGKGNLKRWWTPADKKRFEKKGRILVRQYDGYEVADGVKVNGKLTLGENIADLGGISIAYTGYQKRLEETSRKDILGFTPEQRFFLAVTKFDCELVRPEYQKMAALNDPHSPTIFRVNGPVANMEEFYAAFGVTENDKLYRPKKDRAKIW